MLKSCSVCGRIHDDSIVCRRNYKKNSKAYHFRNSNKWILKREEIKKRDMFLCQICLKCGIYTYKNIQVHHIVSINDDYSKRLDSNNLITLCSYHHKQAENGIISKKELYEIMECPLGLDSLKI